MGDKIKFERGYYILVFCSGERENGDLHIGKVSNISAIKDPYTLMSRLADWVFDVIPYHFTEHLRVKTKVQNATFKANSV